MIGVGVLCFYCGWGHSQAGGPEESRQSKPWGNKPVSSVLPWALHQLLPRVPVLTFLMMNYIQAVSKINPFLFKLLLVVMFYHSNRNLNQDLKEEESGRFTLALPRLSQSW